MRRLNTTLPQPLLAIHAHTLTGTANPYESKHFTRSNNPCFAKLHKMNFDIIIVGAGPAGLCMAQALSGHGLQIAIVEQAELSTLEQPAFDGREIALSLQSVQTMRQLGLWQRIAAAHPQALAPLKDAQVFSGQSRFSLLISHRHSKTQSSELGWFTSNHLIRQAAFDCVQASAAAHQDITLFANTQASRVWSDAQAAYVEIQQHGQPHPRQLQAQLLIAADSRFSATRRCMGISAEMHDFGHNMLVCEMTHTTPHQHIAREWFAHKQTLALLPMHDDAATGLPRSSIVLTQPAHALHALLQLSDADFGAEISRRFAHTLGTMHPASTRHIYPLTGVYPNQLIAQRFACVGDAAVGMHPATAHGFNFGLLGIATLSQLLLQAHHSKQNIASPALLERYQRQHRLTTKPLYLITKAIVQMYSSANPAIQLLCNSALQLCEHLPPFKRAVATSLTGQASKLTAQPETQQAT